MFAKKWWKNVVLAATALAAVTALIGGDLVWSYVQGARRTMRDGLRDATSIRFDLARLDQAIEDLTPMLQENRKTAAELDVEIEYLANDTQKMEERQALAKAEMQELRGMLNDADAQFLEIDGRKYSRAEVEEDLLRRLQAFQQVDEQLKTRRSILAKRRETFARAVASIKDNEQKQQMLSQLADGLNAELRMLEVAAATGGFALKGPDLASAQQLATEVEKRIRTLQKLADEQSTQQVAVNHQRRSAPELFDELFDRKPD